MHTLSSIPTPSSALLDLEREADEVFLDVKAALLKLNEAASDKRKAREKAKKICTPKEDSGT